MNTAILKALLRKLLDYLRAWTNSPLEWLLRLISLLCRYFCPRHFDHGKTLPDMYNRGGFSFTRPDERAIVLASSCPPSIPPSLHTRASVRSVDSVFSIPIFDTLRNSDDGLGGDHLSSLPLPNEKERKWTTISPTDRQGPRYDRNVVM